MATKYRIVAHAMHQDEIALAERLLPQGKVTPAFVTGEAGESEIKTLRAGGLIVDILSEIDDRGRPKGLRPETPGGGARPLPGTVRPMSIPSAPSRETGDREPAVDLARPNVFLIQINGPLLDEYGEALAAIGVKLLDAYRNGFYSAFLTLDQLTRVRDLDFVASVELYDAAHTASSVATAGLRKLALPETREPQVLKYDIVLHRAEDRDKVTAWLKQHDVEIVGLGRTKIRVILFSDSPLRAEIDNLPEVKLQEQYIEPTLANDAARHLLGVERAGGAVFPFDGSGQIVAIADTGLDQHHPDFAGRLVAVVGLGTRGDHDDLHGHGTHVAGSLLGSGAASGGQFQGVAPAAMLYFQALQDGGGVFGGLPVDLKDLLEPAYQAGARIHNNSWGASTKSTYPTYSREIDEFVSQKRDILVVIAAGNDGRADVRENTSPGVVDWLSIASPGTAKNALTVGASRGDRVNGGISQKTWRAYDSKFPDSPIGDETVSGDPNSLAAFSSRGPSDDRRIKPDVVAPGTNVISTKASRAPDGNFWGLYPPNAQYAYWGGTSMAAPLVAGCAALVRQYYIERRNHQPSAALLRATIVNGTRWLQGRDANESNPPSVTPPGNYDQGFGCVNMATTIPNPGSPALTLDFVDNWNDAATQFTRTGDYRRFALQVAGGTYLRICLAYTDEPARGAQNILKLFVQKPDEPKKITGNQQLRNALGRIDRDNNVQIVRINNPAPGPYLIQIEATTLLRQPQDFALVVTGEFGTSRLMPI